jgi:hypothetical protein
MIQVPYDRNVMEELVYGTEGIPNEASNKNPGIPANSSVFVSHVNGVELLFCSV